MMRTLVTLLASLCVLTSLQVVSCGGDKIAQSEWERLAAIRAEAEDAWTDLMTAAYQSDSTGMSGYYNGALSKHRSLFTRDNIELLKRIERHFGASPDSTAINLLKVYVIAGYCSTELADRRSDRPPLVIELYAPDLCPSLVWSKLEKGLAAADDRQQRLALYAQSVAGLQGQAEQIKQSQAVEDSLFRTLGYESSLDFYLEFHRTSSESIRSLAKSALASSDSVYYALLAQVTGFRADAQAGSLRLFDLPHLMTNAQSRLVFPIDSVLTWLQSTFTGMDIPVDLNDVFDVAAKGNDGHFECGGVYPLRLPDKIRVLLGLEKGRASLLYGHMAAGRALPYYFTEARDFTSRYLGDNSSNFANGFFFGGFLANSDYLVSQFEMSKSDAARTSNLVRLLMLVQMRRDCALVTYETALLSGEGDPGTIFAEQMHNALGVTMDNQDQSLRYGLITVLNSADRLRGAALALRMMSRLKEDFGPNLYEQPATGKALATLWSHGHDLSVEQEMRLLDLRTLSESDRGR
jgi:hypothetical protein